MSSTKKAFRNRPEPKAPEIPAAPIRRTVGRSVTLLRVNDHMSVSTLIEKLQKLAAADGHVSVEGSMYEDEASLDVHYDELQTDEEYEKDVAYYDRLMKKYAKEMKAYEKKLVEWKEWREANQDEIKKQQQDRQEKAVKTAEQRLKNIERDMAELAQQAKELKKGLASKGGSDVHSDNCKCWGCAVGSEQS